MAPQSNARMGGVIGSPTPQAQPWAQATQQQAGIQQAQGRNQPRNYYGESEPAVEPQQPAQQPSSGEAYGASPSYDWQQQAQVPQAPQPIQASQSSAAPGMAVRGVDMAQRRVPQQRSYYGE